MIQEKRLREMVKRRGRRKHKYFYGLDLNYYNVLLYLFFSRLFNYCTHVIYIHCSNVKEDEERGILKFHHLFLHPDGLQASRLHNHSHLSGGKDEMRTDTCCNSLVLLCFALSLELQIVTYNSMMKRIMKGETLESKKSWYKKHQITVKLSK